MARWGRVDYRQWVKFRDRLEKLEAVDIPKFQEDSVRELADRLLRKAKRKTPTGKKPRFDGIKTVKVKGTKRSRTFMTAKWTAYQQYWAGYVGGELKRNWKIGNVVKNGTVFEVEVFNQTPYASYVEFGHRQTPGRYVPALGKILKRGWVTGKFMLTISEKELQKDADKIVERKLEALLKEAFNGNGQ